MIVDEVSAKPKAGSTVLVTMAAEVLTLEGTFDGSLVLGMYPVFDVPNATRSTMIEGKRAWTTTAELSIITAIRNSSRVRHTAIPFGRAAAPPTI